MVRQISPANAWCFTLNNYTKTEYEFLSSRFLSVSEKYLYIVGKEVGEQGTPHLQGYVALRNAKKKFRPLPAFAVERDGKNAMHFERAKGSTRQNYFYCSKEGDFITNIPKPMINVKEANKVLETPPEIVDNDDECGVKNSQQREEAAIALLKVDFDIMDGQWLELLTKH